MSDLKKILKEEYAKKKLNITPKLLMEMIEDIIREEMFYKDKDDSLKGPISSPDKVAEDIIKYFKREYPQYFATAELEFQGGTRVLKFTNFGSLKTRDEVIRDLQDKGWLSTRPEDIKRSKMFHRATTNFVDKKFIKSKNKEVERPIIIQLNAGGGAARAGDDYENEIVEILNKQFSEMGLDLFAKKEGGSTDGPDVLVYRSVEDSSNMNNALHSFEAKTTIGGVDFGQFQIMHDPESRSFIQKTQLKSPTLVNIFEEIKDEINTKCSVDYDPQKSGELITLTIDNMPDLVEEYYREKGTDYIIVGDQLYPITDSAASKTGLPRFKDMVEGDFIRIRVKCHGKSYSTTAALKFKNIKDTKKYYEEKVFDDIFK
jgi:hypothetical protein